MVHYGCFMGALWVQSASLLLVVPYSHKALTGEAKQRVRLALCSPATPMGYADKHFLCEGEAVIFRAAMHASSFPTPRSY